MKRVLVTGMSGTGKSSVLAALRARGFKTVDTDYGDWSEQVDIAGSGGKEWLWREHLMTRLLATENAEVLFVSGTVRNQTKFYGRFNHVVLLTAPVTVMTERLARRTNNPYGKNPAELPRSSSSRRRSSRRSGDQRIWRSTPAAHSTRSSRRWSHFVWRADSEQSERLTKRDLHRLHQT